MIMKNFTRRFNLLWIFIVLIVLQNSIAQNLDWKALYGTIEQKEVLGEKALFLSKGLAVLENSYFENGVIEVDIFTSLMAGITFRIDSSYNYEESYIRTPKSGGFDALQYGPVFNGEFCWQFYPEYQAKVIYPANDWIHLKIIVKDDQATIYVGNKDTANLYIDSLRTTNSFGKVGLWTLTGAYFKNFNYQPLTAQDKFPTITKRKIDNPNAIKEWWISKRESFPKVFEETLKEKFIVQKQWKKTETEPDGYLNINKYTRKAIWGQTRKNSNDMVWLLYEWEETINGFKPLSFEYSNKCFIYLNNIKIFSGNNNFQLKGVFYRGDIDKKMRANTVFLPVKKGKNSLLVAVSGITNGWGFMAQFADGSGL